MADVILHNRPEGTPSDNEFVAYGTPTTPSGQIKLSNFYTLLMSKLGFFKVSNLFSEIFGNPISMASARANLSVPSVSDMQTADGLRALKSNVIEKDSTVAFTPTIGTHPVNKAYIDNNKASGTFRITNPWATTEYTINIGKTMPSNNYIVTLMNTTDHGFKGQYPPSITNRTTTSFKIRLDIENDGILLDSDVIWSLNML